MGDVQQHGESVLRSDSYIISRHSPSWHRSYAILNPVSADLLSIKKMEFMRTKQQGHLLRLRDVSTAFNLESPTRVREELYHTSRM